MELENYVKDLERFVKDRLTYFVSEHYIEDPENVPGSALREFMEGELEKVTLTVDSAYITEHPEFGQHCLKVNLRMGEDVYSTHVNIDSSVISQTRRK